MSWQLRFCNELGGKLAVKKMEQAMIGVLRELYKAGCDLNEAWAYNHPMWTMLLEDSEVPSSVIKFLFEHGAKLPPQEEDATPPLFTALENQMDADIIELLVEYGADATYVGKGNETTLQIACRSITYDVDTMRLLVEHGSPVNLQKDDCGNSPLGNATLFDLNSKVIEYLVSVGADIHALDVEGNTPLMRLCFNTRYNISKVKFLIACGSDPNQKNQEGYSSLGLLCQGDGCPAMLKTLLEHGMDVNAVENGCTYPMIAALNDNWEAVEKLLTLGFTNKDILHPETGKSFNDIFDERSGEHWDDDIIDRISRLLA